MCMANENETNSIPGDEFKSVEVSNGKIENFKSKLWPQFIATFAATMSAFGMGTVEAYTSPAIPSMQSMNSFGYLSASIQGKMASVALLAALLCGPPIGFLINKIGRKNIILLLAIPFISGWAIIAAAHNLDMIYIGRLLTGFCAGAASLVVPIYIGEIAEDKVRGMLCSGFQFMVTIGNLFGYIFGSFLDWKELAIVSAVVPLIGFLIMVWMPTSPIYLLTKEKRPEAIASLMWLRGAKNMEDIEPELRSMEMSIAMNNKGNSILRDVFKMRTIKPMSICFLLLLFQQMTGIEAVLMYTVNIFQEAGSNWDPNICTILVGSLQVIATFFSVALVDKAGRRKLLIMSEVGAGLSMLTLGAFFYFKHIDPTVIDRFGWIPLVSLGSFIMFFAIGIGPVPFLMLAELNSAKMIGVASAVATTVNWSGAYVVTLGMMEMQEIIGMHWCFVFFACATFIGLLYVIFFVPETKGKSMEDIQKQFQKVKKIIPTISGSV